MKTSQKRLVLLIFASALWAMAATSCNTFHGFGKDVENAGHKIHKAGN